METNKRYYAHTYSGGKEPLEDHLKKTGDLCKVFASEFGCETLGDLLGGTHDLGKHTERFQKILDGEESKIDHAAVAAILLFHSDTLFQDKDFRRHIAGIVAAHHSKLVCDEDYFAKIEDYTDDENNLEIHTDPNDDRKRCALSSENEYREILQYAKDHGFLHKVREEEVQFCRAMTDGVEKMLIVKFLFSCLVDADYSATASVHDSSYFDRNVEQTANAEEMLKKLALYHSRFDGKEVKGHSINALRNQVYRDCAQKGIRMEPGIYTLTAPTGTAKTLALMRFALEQAKRNHQKRIIVILPFLSIIAQNAKVYKEIFGEDAVLECDSQTEYDEQVKELSDRWNSPIIITTAVTFFETMFSAKSVSLRKLHQLANAVIVYDECQTLPEKLLDATLEAVSTLPKYRSTILFSTATLPVFQYRKNLKSWNPTEIINDTTQIFDDYRKIKRTKVEWVTDQTFTPEELISYFEKERQVLWVFNTVKKAEQMYNTLCDFKDRRCCILLTSRMCSAHKLRIIEDIKRKSQEGEELYIISTQCIEAGVDIDMPVGAREFAPLSSIIQTAGRINRNGRGEGKLLIFRHKNHGEHDYPSTDYRNASEKTFVQAQTSEIDFYSRKYLDKYYEALYHTHNFDTDDRELTKAIQKEDYRGTEEEYQFIRNEKNYNIIVPYTKNDNDRTYWTILEELKSNHMVLTSKMMKICRGITVTVRTMEGLRDCCEQLFLKNYKERKETNWWIMTEAECYQEQGVVVQKKNGFFY